jgi:hypothetical protein
MDFDDFLENFGVFI